MNTLKPGDKVRDTLTGFAAVVVQVTPYGAKIQIPFVGSHWRGESALELLPENKPSEPGK